MCELDLLNQNQWLTPNLIQKISFHFRRNILRRVLIQPDTST